MTYPNPYTNPNTPILPPDATPEQKEYFYNVVLPAHREHVSAQERERDRLLNIGQSNKRLAQQQAQFDANLNAQSENQRRQLGFQREVHRGELGFRQSSLEIQRQRSADESAYRNKLLESQESQLSADRAERSRVRQETTRQFNLQLKQQQSQYDKTLAFNKERAAENDKNRIQAQSHAEAGARRQVLSSLGYHDQKSKVGSPVESLLLRLQRNRTNRPRLRTV